MKRVFLLLLACCLLIAPAAAAGGSGTAADPYVIQTAAELQSIQNNLAAYYKLASNINMQDVSFTPIGSTSSPFIGSFDGAGYTISNLVISSSTQSTGFFSCLSNGATIKDITFQDCSVTSTSSRCGVVVGSIIMSSSAHDTTVISGVDCVRCIASTSSHIVGCLVGECYGASTVVIDSSTVQNSIAYSDDTAGCLVGECYGASTVNALNCDIVNCLAMARIYVAGIFGICDTSGSVVTAQTCTVTGCTIVATGNYAGGIVGRCTSGTTGTFSVCTVTDSTIITSDYAAGICPRYS